MPTETEKIVQAIWSGAALFDRQAIRDAINIYREINFEDLIRTELMKQFVSPDVRARMMPLITTEINMAKIVVEHRAMVYKNKAVRKALLGEGENAKNDARYEEIQETSGIDSAMKVANQYTTLVNHTLLRPVVRDLNLEIDVILPDCFEIYTDTDDWKDIVGIKYYIGVPQDLISRSLTDKDVTLDSTQPFSSPSALGRVGDMVFKKAFFWVKKSFDLNGFTLQPGIYEALPKQRPEDWLFTENEYKDEEGKPILPFVLTYKTYPVDQLLNYSIGSNITHNSILVSIYFTMLNELMKFQSFLQTVITGDTGMELPKDIQGGPGTIWKILSNNNNANVSVIDVQAKIMEFKQVIVDRVTLMLSQEGIPPTSFTLTGVPESGYKMKMNWQALIEKREDDIEHWRCFERDLFKITRIVNNTDIPNKPISKDAEFSIDFGEVDFSPSPQEEAAYWTSKIAANVATPVDWIKYNNPDLDDDAALEKYNENKALNQKNSPLQPLQAPTKPGANQKQGKANMEPLNGNNGETAIAKAP